MNSKPFYTDDEQIRRVWDIEEIKKLMAKRAFYHANDMRREELDNLWVQDPKNRAEASLGLNWGWYVGFDEISNYYAVRHMDMRRMKLDEYRAAHPEIADTRDNLGYGSMQVYPLSTAHVKLAGDGRTARGIWYSIGQETVGNADGTGSASWVCQKIAADFIREKDEWKIWHIVFGLDLTTPVGEGYHTTQTLNPWKIEFLSGKPTVEMLAHDTSFNWSDDWPPVPVDYPVYDAQYTSYAPTGYKETGRPVYKRQED